LIEKILQELSCGDVICSCSTAIDRGRGLTHCPSHEDPVPSLNVELGDRDKILLHCHGGCTQEEVVSELRTRGLWAGGRRISSAAELRQLAPTSPTGRLVSEYEYVDRDGRPVFYVERYDPKDFRQRKADGTRSGVSSVWCLYRLPEVVAAVQAKQTIFITEGEKDADALRSLGVVATTAPGGAGKWRDTYAEDLIGADVIVCVDKDAVNEKTGRREGEHHGRTVAESLSVAARAVRILEFPGRGKDAADWVANGGSKLGLDVLVADLPEWHSGEKVMRTPKDLAREYLEIIDKRISGDRDQIGWLPGFRSFDRDLAYVPGDFWIVAAATGVGKSTMLQSLQQRCPVPSVYFSIEMPWIQLLDRMVAAETRIDSWSLARGVINAEQRAMIHAAIEAFSARENEIIVDNPGLNTTALETLVRIARARFGVRVVFVDYAQRLSDREGEGEYERVSKISNNIARIARVTGTTIVAAAQVNRKGSNESGEPPSMRDLRDSGYLEQDASVVLTIGRKVGETPTKVRVEKNRNGVAGQTYDLVFDALHGQFIESVDARIGTRARQGDN
jgi:hypothetical protein